MCSTIYMRVTHLSRPRKRRVWTRDLPPGITVDLVDEEIVEECSESPIIVFATKQEQLSVITW